MSDADGTVFYWMDDVVVVDLRSAKVMLSAHVVKWNTAGKE